MSALSDPRAYKRAWENENDRPLCACGTRMGVGSHRHGNTRCAECRDREKRAKRTERAERIATMWKADVSMRQIAQELGWTMSHLGGEMSEIRKMGLADLPHRYRMVDGERKAAA